MEPVARELSKDHGVLEPLQTRSTLQGQVEELMAAIEDHADLPVTLIGHSWGAMLSYILSSKYPQLVRKLIMVGSAVFDEKYARDIDRIRSERLGDKTDDSVESHIKADSYDPMLEQYEGSEFQRDIFNSVWPEAEELRRSGRLLEMGSGIKCPVVALHGDYDPHPAAGVKGPLSRVLKDFKFIVLKRCGHYPWLERQARCDFYRLLKIDLA